MYMYIFQKITGADDATESDGAIALILISLSTFSVSYNTFLYVSYNTGFREGFKQLFRFQCLRSSNEQSVNTVS